MYSSEEEELDNPEDESISKILSKLDQEEPCPVKKKKVKNKGVGKSSKKSKTDLGRPKFISSFFFDSLSHCSFFF